MAYSYTYIDGQRVEVHVAAAFKNMAAAFQKANGYTLHIKSGVRTYAEQEALYNGWIQRLPGYNLAAAPWSPYAYHVETNPSGPRAIDIYDSAPFPGVTQRGTKHDLWMQNNASKFGFENEGYTFNPAEPWHKKFVGAIDGTTAGSGSSIPLDQTVLGQQQFLNAARGESLTPDGLYGSATKAAFERYQVFLRDNYGYTGAIDGVWGPATETAHQKYYAVWKGTTSTPPKFPLPAGYYFGPADGPEQSISGLYSYKGALTPWQQRMKDRGWPITPDGIYGDQTKAVASAFQKEKGFTVDGLIGPETWNGAWTTPVTPPGGAVPTTPTVPPNPTTTDNPRGLPVYTPVYPGAYLGLIAPLGDGLRSFKGDTPVEPIIDMFIIHRTGTNGDDTDWFSYKNSRSSCPNVHVLSDGRAKEFIRPFNKPALTGPEYNYRSFGIEIQGAGDGNPAQFEKVADMMAWLASFNGKTLDGIPVSFTLDRAHVKYHKELIPGTECPGPWWIAKIPELIERAKVILDEKYDGTPPGPDPEPEPEPDPDTVTVSRAEYDAWVQTLEGLAALMKDAAE